ncbi:MAG: RNA polymerase sigma factor [Bacteroidetes bacterium]|nr:RNA polymerase sigma factor [Bacteroidota bacterium]MCY4205825.1 RNA polymerase sigma factor [Bacteroidota bacterium]
MSRFDPSIVERAQQGDESAMNLLLRRLTGVYKNYFRAKVGNQAIVDDLVQCSLLRVHSGLNVLRQPEKFKSFAMKAALFELHDYYRGRHSPKEKTYDPEMLPEASDSSSQWSGSTFDVQRALETLTPHARRILELREHGYKYKEIAQILDTTETAVKMQVKRGFEKMKSIFTD